MRRPLTALERAAADSGHPLEWFVRRLAGRGASARQLQSAQTSFRRALRCGGCSWEYAHRVAYLLDAVQTPLHDLLLKPRPCWPAWAVEAPVSTDEAPGKTGRSERCDKAAGKRHDAAGTAPNRVRPLIH